MFIDGASPTLADCHFDANTSDFGGALFLDGSDALISQCDFVENHALNRGGAAIMINSTGEFNTALESAEELRAFIKTGFWLFLQFSDNECILRIQGMDT